MYNSRALGPLSRAPYSYRKEKETHEFIFSWLFRLVAVVVELYKMVVLL